MIAGLPDVDMVYWDYYHMEDRWYEHMLSEHERMSENTVFAGGVWTWSGFMPQVKRTDATMVPALKACARHGVRTAIATMWGDDGTETDYFLAMSQMTLFSEACWRGEDYDMDEARHMAETLTGLPREVYEGFGCFYKDETDDRTGKGLIYCDLLYPLLPHQPDLAAAAEQYTEGLRRMALCETDPRCRYGAALFRVAREKAQLILQLRAAYKNKDASALRRIAEEKIPALVKLYDALEEAHRTLWWASYKRLGWENITLRYGAVKGRLRDVSYTLNCYCDSRLPVIEELEYPELEASRKDGIQFFQVYVSPQFDGI